MTRQCELLNISRGSLYYEPLVNEQDIATMHAIDELFTKYPFYGSRKMKYALNDEYGIHICRDKVRRLMHDMGLEAVYPKPKTSTPHPDHEIYPYLLRNVPITHPNHVWSSDITYVRLDKGFCYLTALMDWFSRYVIAWSLSQSLQASFCVDTLTQGLSTAKPDIHNSDQGSQYTGTDYIELLKSNNISISMDGRGRFVDNIFTERLWRSVKYENVYVKGYETIIQAHEGLADYFQFYNTKRPHQSLNNLTPYSVYYKT